MTTEITKHYTAIATIGAFFMAAAGDGPNEGYIQQLDEALAALKATL